MYKRQHYDGVKKLETTSGGVEITGNLVLDGYIDMGAQSIYTDDNGKVRLGTGDDFQIYHDGTNSYIKNTTGNIRVFSSGSSEAISIVADGVVSLSHANAVKLATASGGVTVTGTISAGAASFTDDGSAGPVINISGDDQGLWYGRIGNETYHDNVGTGFRFYVANDGDAHFIHHGNAEYVDWSISSNNGTTSQYDIYRTAAGAVYLYNSGNVKLQTTTAGISVTGSVTDSTGELRTIVQNTQSGAYTLVAADAGKHILASGNITVPDSVFSAGQAITIVNNTAGNLTITKGTNMYNTADGSNANRTLATRGMATLLFTAADTAYISGAGLS